MIRLTLVLFLGLMLVPSPIRAEENPSFQSALRLTEVTYSEFLRLQTRDAYARHLEAYRNYRIFAIQVVDQSSAIARKWIADAFTAIRKTGLDRPANRSPDEMMRAASVRDFMARMNALIAGFDRGYFVIAPAGSPESQECYKTFYSPKGAVTNPPAFARGSQVYICPVAFELTSTNMAHMLLHELAHTIDHDFLRYSPEEAQYFGGKWITECFATGTALAVQDLAGVTRESDGYVATCLAKGLIPQSYW